MAAHGQSEGWRLRAPSTLSKCVLEEADEMAYGCHLPHALGHCANVTSVTFEEEGGGGKGEKYSFFSNILSKPHSTYGFIGDLLCRAVWWWQYGQAFFNVQDPSARCYRTKDNRTLDRDRKI